MFTNYNRDYEQHEEMIFAEKGESQAKYANNIYVDTCWKLIFFVVAIQRPVFDLLQGDLQKCII